MSTRNWQVIEGGLVAVAAYVAVVLLDYPWYLPLALFLLWDLAALGYLANPRVDAFFYNLVHNYGGPAVLGVVGVTTSTWQASAIALCWAFHVGVDRALGYGLKHPDHFQHTHLGWIGKARGELEEGH